jgi:bile acid-coenzyme A ligase
MAAGRAQLYPGPMYHNGPFSMSCRGLMCGNHVVTMRRFDAEQTLALLARHRVDWTLLVPTMMHRIWRLPAAVRAHHDLPGLRIVLHLAAPCPAWLKREWIGWLGPDRVHELYAGTEAQGITWIDGHEALAHPGSVGRIMEGFQLQIRDEAGRPLPAGEVGEVYMRPDAGPGTTYHYVGAEPKQIEGGWESLGDMGWVDAEGYLYLTDRRNDMILSGGANIYPAEVEAAIDTHPAVRSSCVIGLPDDDLGSRVHAIVDAIAPVGEEALLAHLAERLVRYKIPRSIEFVREPLRDDAGKVRRTALRQERLAKQ